MSIQNTPLTYSSGRPVVLTLALVIATAMLVLCLFSTSHSSPTKNSLDETNAINNNILTRGSADESKTVSFDPSHKLDFAVIGFPKSGTSFLLEVLGMHPEITMPSKEFCDIHHDNGDKLFMRWIKNQSALHPSGQKYGIKCPTMIRVTNAIDNLMKVSDQTRLVVGVRHPVLWFQSFYNYRSVDMCANYKIAGYPIFN
jgi:hypothetical protein